MTKRLFFIATAAMTTLLAGCSTNHTPNAPLSERDGAWGKNLCLVDNETARPQVFIILRRALMDKGFHVTRIEGDDSPALSQCQQFIRYEAVFGSSWSQSPLRYAKLELTERARHDNVYTVSWDERKATPTLYDAIEDAEVELRQLVDRLMPSDIPWH